MTNPTRQEIIEAHRALTHLSVLASDRSTTSAMIHEKIVRSCLPPIPRPTMADVEWDDDKHYLAEAEHPDFGKVIMLGLNARSLIDFFAPKRYSSRFKEVPPEDLTPTGRRYTLTEVQ